MHPSYLMESTHVACLFGSPCLAVSCRVGILSDAQAYGVIDCSQACFCIEIEEKKKAPELICAFLRWSKLLPKWMELPFPAAPPVSGVC